ALGFGFIQRVPRSELDAFIAAQRADASPDFAIRTMSGPATTTDLPESYITRFIEPRVTNQLLEGYDSATDPVRREALERAMLSGEPTLSARVTLVQDARSRPGFLYFLPVYRNGTHPTTPDERRRDLFGWIDAPIVIEQALAGVTSTADGLLELEIFDGPEAAIGTRLFDDDGQGHATIEAATKDDHGARMYRQLATMTVGGRQWTLRCGSTAAFDARHDRTTPVGVGVGGAFASLLLACMVWGLGTGRARALALARDMTTGLASARDRA